jgi:queuine tRNA-ribosyltransferase
VADPLSFRLEACDGTARAGTLTLPHGVVPTPIFMPVGTQATIKGVLPRDVEEIGARIILANTYHLLLRPGPDVVARAGGLHRFMGWDRPILTDSGGFQVFSLAAISRIDDGGVRFKSHIDGSEVLLTPERSIEVQEALGADIIMAFDECPANPAPPDVARRAVERTIAWARRCKAAKRRDDQALFGIQQGGLDAALRRECAERLIEIGFPGYAVGGLAVGEERPAMLDALAAAAPALPPEKPRYLMGVGTPQDILDGIDRGIDMFDCVMPTRNARNTSVFHAKEGRLNLRNARFKEDFGPLEEGCDCLACRRFSRAYLRHLFVADEMVAATLATIHNLRFYLRLVEGARRAILEGSFAAYRKSFAPAVE